MTNEKEILKKLRGICETLVGSTEKTSFGKYPTFQVRKRTFAVYENQPELHGCRILSIKATLAKQAALAKRPGFRPCIYGARHGWTYIDMDRTLDWAEIETLVRDSYALVTPKKKTVTKSGSKA